MEDPLELLKQKFFNKQLSKSEQLLFTEALELDDDFADAVAEELHWREIQFLATHKQMDAETLQKADFRIVVPTTILKSETPFVLEEPAKIAQNTKSWSKVAKYAAAALLGSVALFVGWKQWMPKDSIPKKEGIATPSTIQEVPIAPIDSHSKSAQLPTIESKAPLPQNQKKTATKNEFVTIDSPHLKVEMIENQSVIKEPMVQIPSVEKERQPITKVDNQAVTNVISEQHFTPEMKNILEKLHNPSAGAGNEKIGKLNWGIEFQNLINSKFDVVADFPKIQSILTRAQEEFKGITPEQLPEDISPNQIFDFVILNLSVKPATEQQKKDLKTWFHYRKHYSTSQDNILKRREKLYEEMIEEK